MEQPDSSVELYDLLNKWQKDEIRFDSALEIAFQRGKEHAKNEVQKAKEAGSVEWVEAKQWGDFRKTGLFMFANTILHAFGWALVCQVEYDKELKKELGPVTKVYPARVKFRGFSTEDQTEMHQKIAKFLAENSDELNKEANL